MKKKKLKMKKEIILPNHLFDQFIDEKEIINFEDILLEEKQKKTSSRCYKMFGDYLFGEFSKWYGKEIEKDTPYESQVFTLLKNFIRGNYMGSHESKIKIESSLIKAMRSLQSCMSEYPDILKPKTRNLWRITKTNKEVMSSIDIKKLMEDISKNKNIKKFGNYAFYDIGKTKYIPKSQIQSWSTQNEVVSIFFSPHFFTQIYYIVYNKTFSETELLFNGDFLDEISSHYDIFDSPEHEIIRLGKGIPGCKAYIPIASIFNYLIKLHATVTFTLPFTTRYTFTKLDQKGVLLYGANIELITDFMDQYFGYTNFEKNILKNPREIIDYVGSDTKDDLLVLFHGIDLSQCIFIKTIGSQATKQLIKDLDTLYKFFTTL